MNHFRRLNGLALTLMTMAALSVNVFAMEYSIETEENTGYYPSTCLLYTSPSPRDVEESRMPSSA